MFEVLDGFPPHPQCHRAVCAMCGNARTGEPVVRTGIEADLGEDGFYAQVHVCASCIQEMGRAVGQLDAKQSAALLERCAALESERDFLSEQLTAYRSLDELVRAHVAQLAPTDFVAEAPAPVVIPKKTAKASA